MNEDLEIKRAEVTKRVLESLTVLVEDASKSFTERITAAEVVRGINQDLILSDLSSRGLTQDGDFKNKLLKSSEKLDRNDH